MNTSYVLFIHLKTLNTGKVGDIGHHTIDYTMRIICVYNNVQSW